MRHLDFVELLNRQGLHVFTVRDAQRMLKKRGKYVSLFLSSGAAINRIERGKYYLDGTGINEIASHIVSPCYLSLETAFAFHGLTTQIPININVVSTRRHREIKLRGTKIRFVRLDKSRFFGYFYVNNISMATVEKALLDLLYLDGNGGEAVEAIGAATARGKLDFTLLRDFTIQMHCKALTNKVGFLAELYGSRSDKLLRYRSKNYVPLSKGARLRDARWHVLYEKEWLAVKAR